MQTMKLGLYLEKHVYTLVVVFHYLYLECFNHMICIFASVIKKWLKGYSFINFIFWIAADGGCLRVGMHKYLQNSVTDIKRHQETLQRVCK